MSNDGGDVGAQFGEMDADGDGVLTRDELVLYCATHDAMRGSLGLESSGWAEKIDSLFEEMDKDGSGGISLAEFTEWKNTQPESNKVYRIKSKTTARASKEPNSARLGTLAADDRVVALEEATDDSGRRLIRVEHRADNSRGPGGPMGPLRTPLTPPETLSRPSMTRWKPSWDPLILVPGASG